MKCISKYLIDMEHSANVPRSDLFSDEIYINITGLHFYYDTKPVCIGSILSLKKEPENPHDSEAIAVSVPVFGKIGYVANSTKTVIPGCMSAGRVHEKIPDECAAIVRFISDEMVLARVVPDKKVKVRVEAELVESESGTV